MTGRSTFVTTLQDGSQQLGYNLAVHVPGGFNTAGQFVDFLVYLRYVPLRSDHPECMTDHRVWECGEKTPAGPMNCLGYQQDALIWRGDPISKTEIESVLAPN
jgi:hypothetical protein